MALYNINHYTKSTPLLSSFSFIFIVKSLYSSWYL